MVFDHIFFPAFTNVLFRDKVQSEVERSQAKQNPEVSLAIKQQQEGCLV